MAFLAIILPEHLWLTLLSHTLTLEFCLLFRCSVFLWRWCICATVGRTIGPQKSGEEDTGHLWNKTMRSLQNGNIDYEELFSHKKLGRNIICICFLNRSWTNIQASPLSFFPVLTFLIQHRLRMPHPTRSSRFPILLVCKWKALVDRSWCFYGGGGVLGWGRLWLECSPPPSYYISSNWG